MGVQELVIKSYRGITPRTSHAFPGVIVVQETAILLQEPDAGESRIGALVRSSKKFKSNEPKLQSKRKNQWGTKNRIMRTILISEKWKWKSRNIISSSILKESSPGSSNSDRSFEGCAAKKSV